MRPPFPSCLKINNLASSLQIPTITFITLIKASEKKLSFLFSDNYKLSIYATGHMHFLILMFYYCFNNNNHRHHQVFIHGIHFSNILKRYG